MRKLICASLIAASLFGSTSCENWLDVNTNPNGPDQVVDPHLYLAPIMSEVALGIQFDARYLGMYVNNWHSTTAGYAWDIHGYNTASDNGGQIWRSTYYTSGVNLRDMIAKAEEQKKWDIVGVGYAIQAFNWQITTDYHGEIIMTQAFDPSRAAFDYDKQDVVYAEVKRLSELSLQYFAKAKAEPHANSRLAETDLMYAGDVAKWEKFVYGLLAINAHHLSNKSTYDPAKVIEYVDKSFAGNADNAMVRFTGAVSTDANFFGPMRGNLTNSTLSLRQSDFIVSLLDGTNAKLTDPTLVGQDPVTAFAGQHLKDPRLPVMLAPAPDGQYRGLGYNGLTATYTDANQRPLNLWGTTSDVTNTSATGKYLFQNATSFPLMTYSQLQFIKAEAEFIRNNYVGNTAALTAYKNGVEKHMDFVKTFTPAAEATTFDARRAKYLASTVMMPTDPAQLTLQHIMLQKYIAQWGWGFIEQWSDLRRYHYTATFENGKVANNTYETGTSTDPVKRVFTQYLLPTEANPTRAFANGGPAYRVRPRYNSEYVWNVEALRQIGGLDPAYQTYEMWFTKPE
ncbi:SusD/RagB family nutrient-binding outer membrane lipoprotein [Sabulibacter ruber]|uniref:SusD/RagB family nutrient-binding outer membrane lipoprotein n=1 Tax=Sabulibacter ruber TaxID=2811901 RepID=UPI001A95E570|nr:SusD/RagB family nutrient-binding outer membrane lipoprotein [Sabulibacter ruber]